MVAEAPTSTCTTTLGGDVSKAAYSPNGKLVATAAIEVDGTQRSLLAASGAPLPVVPTGRGASQYLAGNPLPSSASAPIRSLQPRSKISVCPQWVHSCRL